jgi:hypothetical protein
VLRAAAVVVVVMAAVVVMVVVVCVCVCARVCVCGRRVRSGYDCSASECCTHARSRPSVESCSVRTRVTLSGDSFWSTAGFTCFFGLASTTPTQVDDTATNTFLASERSCLRMLRTVSHAALSDGMPGISEDPSHTA